MMNKNILIVDDLEDIHTSILTTLDDQIESQFAEEANQREENFEHSLNDFLVEEKSSSVDVMDFDSKSIDKISYNIVHAYNYEDAIDACKKSIKNNAPFTTIIMDIRMPPGKDGIQTLKKLWKIDPRCYAIICTAFSDYSWYQTIRELGQRMKQVLIVKKPFESVAIQQSVYFQMVHWNEKFQIDKI